MFNGLNISHFSLMGNLNRLQREKKCRMKKVHNLLGAPEVCREIKDGFRKKWRGREEERQRMINENKQRERKERKMLKRGKKTKQNKKNKKEQWLNIQRDKAGESPGGGRDGRRIKEKCLRNHNKLYEDDEGGVGRGVQRQTETPTWSSPLSFSIFEPVVSLLSCLPLAGFVVFFLFYSPHPRLFMCDSWIRGKNIKPHSLSWFCSLRLGF